MGTSLIPIKGISQALIKSLKSSCDISDVAGLLTNGRTPEQRQIIADKLEIDRRYVDMWVKQAALWNVEGMTGGSSSTGSSSSSNTGSSKKQSGSKDRRR